jgi:hypothetical protein
VNPQRYARVKEIFREALRWSPEERNAVVATLAEDDAAVRDEVLSLLAHHDEAPLIREPARSHDLTGGAPSLVEASAESDVGGDRMKDGFLERRTLAELVRSEREGGAKAGWPLERVIRTLDPIAHALAMAADRGAAHGAVRAEHVLVTEVDGEVLAELTGLGDAEVAAGLSGAHATSQIDAAASAAPEQLLPALGPIGPWTDVYALALLCVELMLGRAAAEGSATAALARTRDEAAQPTPRTVGLDVPASVEQVMALALAMRPMERYQNVRRFWEALRESLATSRPAAQSHPLPAPPDLAKRGHRTWALGVAIFAIIAVLVAAAVAMSR